MAERKENDAAATLDRWLAREREIRLLLAAPGKIPVAEIGKSSGLEFLERIGRGELPSTPIGHALDFVPVEWERGRMVFQGTPKSEYYNPIGTVHGGYIATLLDSAVACAVQTTLERPRGGEAGTVDTSVRPVPVRLGLDRPILRAWGVA